MSNEIVGGEIKMEADRLWQQMADELYRLRAERNKLRAALERIAESRVDPEGYVRIASDALATEGEC